jgi:CRISPR/Cas system-associated exonuclease Cas4 (RecB family)
MASRWSFTSWSTYNTCPAKYKFKYIEKVPGLPAGPAAARGTEIHESIANYITMDDCDPDKLHPAVNKEVMLPVFDMYRDHGNGLRFVEVPIYFTKQWEDTIKGHPNRWGMAVFDAVRVGGDWRVSDDPHATVISIAEWKSGKPKDDHKEQRSLYALAGFARWIEPVEVRVTTYYVENTAPPARLTVKRSAEEKLQKLWNGRVEQLTEDEIMAPRPGYYCRWCDYSKERGGPCMF